MKKKLQDKKNIILKFNELLNNFISIIVFNINNISSNKVNNLRKKLKILNSSVYSLKKKLLIKSFIHNNLLNLTKLNISKQIIIIFSNDPIKIIKFLTTFIKNNNYGNINFLYFNKEIYIDEKINFISSLLSYKEIIKKFLFLIKNISINRILKVLILLKKSKNKLV